MESTKVSNILLFVLIVIFIKNIPCNEQISTPGSGSPPVLAKYNPMGTGLNIDNLLLISLREELMPKLQATMFSFVNTSALLGDALPKLREKQEDLFINISQYVNNIVRSLNRITMEKNLGVIDMEDFKLTWNDTIDGNPADNEIHFTNMVMSGLETAYSSHTGGPCKQIHPQISEEIRFSTLRVRGSISYKSDRDYKYDFVAEIEDVAVEISLNIEKLQARKELVQLQPNVKHSFYVSGWRRLELSIPRVHFMYADALVTGFLMKTVPKYIMDHLNENIDKALEQACNKNAGKLILEPKVDRNETLNQSSETEGSENIDKKPLHLMSSDENGEIHVEPYSVEKEIPNKNSTIINLVPKNDLGKQQRQIGKKYEMIIISEETHTSDSGRYRLDQAKSLN